MGHRKWSLFGAGAESMEGAMREHNALYDAWVEATNWRTECLDENNRLDRELDEARQAQDNLIFQRNDFRHWHMNEQKKVADLTAELDEARKRIAELESPIRVPFSAAQIERMARGLRQSYCEHYGITADGVLPDYYKELVRAALAAGGMEPCAVPTGHVLRDRLVDAEAKIERQRKNLRQLYEARERDARLIADLRAEVDEDNAADLLVQVQNLTAERDAQEIELADLRFYQREFAAVSAERNALRERASVPVKVRIKRTAHDMERDWLNIVRKYAPEDDNGACPWLQDCLCDFATQIAAHAVIDAPAGVPSVEEQWRVCTPTDGHYAIENSEGIFGGWRSPDGLEEICEIHNTAIRDPVGCEMDVTWQEMQEWLEPDSIGRRSSPHEILDLCRSRIRPVYECKECAYKQTRIHRLEGWIGALEGYCDDMRKLAAQLPARAALEGE